MSVMQETYDFLRSMSADEPYDYWDMGACPGARVAKYLGMQSFQDHDQAFHHEAVSQGFNAATFQILASKVEGDNYAWEFGRGMPLSPSWTYGKLADRVKAAYPHLLEP